MNTWTAGTIILGVFKGHLPGDAVYEDRLLVLIVDYLSHMFNRGTSPAQAGYYLFLHVLQIPVSSFLLSFPTRLNFQVKHSGLM